MTDIPMKPCPLACGGPAEWISVHPQGYIRCTKCKLATIIDDQFELTEAWNTRPPTANPLPDEVGALIDALVSEIRGPEMPEGYYRQRIVAFAERLSTDRDSVQENDPRLTYDGNGDITLEVVWSLKVGQPTIIAICSSDEIAERYRPYAEQRVGGTFYVEHVLLDHAFGRRDVQSAIYKAAAIRARRTV